MIIPTYLTMTDGNGDAVLKEPIMRDGHKGQPHMDRPEACRTWPGDSEPAPLDWPRADALYWLFNYCAMPWKANAVQIWNATVPEFKAERAYVGSVNCQYICSAWSGCVNWCGGREDEVMDWLDLTAYPDHRTVGVVQLSDVKIPDFVRLIDAAIMKYEGAAA